MQQSAETITAVDMSGGVGRPDSSDPDITPAKLKGALEAVQKPSGSQENTVGCVLKEK